MIIKILHHIRIEIEIKQKDMLRCPCMNAHRASQRLLQSSWSCRWTCHKTTDTNQASFHTSSWCFLRKQHNAPNMVDGKTSEENLRSSVVDSVQKYRRYARKESDAKPSTENTVAELPSTVTELGQFLQLDRVTVVQCIKDFTGEESVPIDFVLEKELVKRIIKHVGRERKLPPDAESPPPQSLILSIKKKEPSEATGPENENGVMTNYLSRLNNLGREVNQLRIPVVKMQPVTKQYPASIDAAKPLDINIEDRDVKPGTDSKHLVDKVMVEKSQTMKQDLIARQAKFRQGAVSVLDSQVSGTVPGTSAELYERLGIKKEEVLHHVQEITGEALHEEEMMGDKALLARLLSQNTTQKDIMSEPKVQANAAETVTKDDVQIISSHISESSAKVMHADQLTEFTGIEQLSAIKGVEAKMVRGTALEKPENVVHSEKKELMEKVFEDTDQKVANISTVKEISEGVQSPLETKSATKSKKEETSAELFGEKALNKNEITSVPSGRQGDVSTISITHTATPEPVKIKEEMQSGEAHRTRKKKLDSQHPLTTEHRKSKKVRRSEVDQNKKESESLKSLFKSFQKTDANIKDEKLHTAPASSAAFVIDSLVNDTELAQPQSVKPVPEIDKTLNEIFEETAGEEKGTTQLFSNESQTLKASSKDYVHKEKISQIHKGMLDDILKESDGDKVIPISNENTKTLDSILKSLEKSQTSASNFVAKAKDFKIDSIFQTDDPEQDFPDDSVNVTASPAFELDELKDTFKKLNLLKTVAAQSPQSTMKQRSKTLKDMNSDTKLNAEAPEEDNDQEVKESNKTVLTVSSANKKTENKSDVQAGPIYVPRPPVVTIMGHVDHGKTTLLDALRHTRVVDTEFGGITQHIGAFNVQLSSGHSITFLDTPGHAAFSAMRSRGASVTDIIVLVIAAEDGVMPQTIESIQLAQAADVPLIVAINKIDKPNANVGAVKNLLAQYGVLLEEHGGDVQVVPISALKGINLDKLQECIVSLAEFLELKGDVSSLVEARIIETHTDVGLGKMATMVINRGVLRKGDYLLSGTAYTKVRTIFDCKGSPVTEAGPGIPVEIGGWKEMPQSGDLVQQYANEKLLKLALQENEEIVKAEVESRAREEADERWAADRETYVQIRDKRREEYVRWWNYAKKNQVANTILEQKGRDMAEDNRPVVRIIIKGDVSGSVEAILDTLSTFTSDLCDLDIVHHGVGNVTEMDLQMASTFNADIYAFNLDLGACKSDSKVTTRHYNVIYHLFAQLIEHINAQLPPSEKEDIIGEAVVQQSFEITVKKDKVQIAGCRCRSGALMRSKRFRLIRGDEVLYDGPLHSMKHHKLEVNIIKTDQDCGLCLEPGLVSQPGDTIVCYDMVKVRQKLDWQPAFDLKTDV